MTQTIHLVLIQTPVSYYNPGPLNLPLKGAGSWIQKSVPSTVILHLWPGLANHRMILKMNLCNNLQQICECFIQTLKKSIKHFVLINLPSSSLMYNQERHPPNNEMFF